jgi:ankyrin-2
VGDVRRILPGLLVLVVAVALVVPAKSRRGQGLADTELTKPAEAPPGEPGPRPSSPELPPIAKATQDGDVAKVRELLAQGADPNARYPWGVDYTLLHMAALRGFADVAEVLLDRKADPNAANRFGERPLHLALRAGKLAVVELLLRRGADPNAVDHDGQTPLHLACWVYKDRPAYVQLLLDHGADVNARNRSGDTPLRLVARGREAREVADLLLAKGATQDLFTAAALGDEAVLGRLLAGGAEPNATDSVHQTPLMWATEAQHPKTVATLLEHRADARLVNSDGEAALHFAAWRPSVEIAKLLLDHGADPNAKTTMGTTPLHRAAATRRDVEMIRLLLDRGADPNLKENDGEKPLYYALHEGQTEAARLLLERGTTHTLITAVMCGNAPKVREFLAQGADPNHKGPGRRKPIHWAAYFGRTELVKLFLDRGVSPDEPDGGYQRPLHLAASQGQVEVAKLLLQRGARMTLQADPKAGGPTPVHEAASEGQLEVLRVFLDHGAPVDVRSACGDTPLDWAAMDGQVATAQFLVERGANVNGASPPGSLSPGWTPLYRAVVANKPEMVRFLIAHGAEASPRDASRHTPLWVARDRGNREAADALVECGAKE